MANGPGIHGKHPAFGDFLTADLPASAETGLLPWLDQTLAQLRDHLGDEGWPAMWDGAQPLRFWIGGALWGGAHLRGVLMPSRDKVGRRYPLMLVADTAAPAPVLDSGQQFHDAAEAALAGDFSSLADLRAQLAADPTLGAETPAEAVPSPDFWAANPSLEPAALLAELAATDHLIASARRSYWWTTPGPGRAGAALSCDQLPQPQALAWLLAGVASDSIDAAPEIPAEVPTEPILLTEGADARNK